VSEAETPVVGASRPYRLGATAIVLVAFAFHVARILLAPVPVSDNDVSRWLTVCALETSGSFVVGARVQHRDGSYGHRGLVKEMPTVDIVTDPATNSVYSSKPPLLPLLLFGVTKPVLAVTGWDCVGQLRSVGRTVTLLTFGPLLLLYLLALAGILGRLRVTATDALVVLGVGAFATLATTFATVVTNHFPAAVGCAVALYSLLRADDETRARWLWWVVGGLGAGVAASQEPPAALLVVGGGAVAWRQGGLRGVLFFAQPAVLPILLSLGATAAVFGDPLLLFGGRDEHWTKYPGSYWHAPTGLDASGNEGLAYGFHFLLGHHGWLSLTPIFVLAVAPIVAAVRGRGTRPWLAPTLATVVVLLLPLSLEHYINVKRYVWFQPISLYVLFVALYPWGWWRDASARPIARLALFCSVPTLSFYLAYTTNYGGITSGPRWLVWLIPLWLYALAPELRVARAGWPRRVVVATLIGLSLVSSLTPGLSPFRHPWLFELWQRAFGGA
jgi:hypothetical protein